MQLSILLLDLSMANIENSSLLLSSRHIGTMKFSLIVFVSIFAAGLVASTIEAATTITNVQHGSSVKRNAVSLANGSASRKVEGSIGVTIDPVAIGKAISNAISSAANREGAVKNMRNTVFYALKQKYNVMVFNLSQSYRHNLKGVKYYTSAKCGSVVYGIWAFEKGVFENLGDGGFINWAFVGNFKRNGGHVTFY